MKKRVQAALVILWILLLVPLLTNTEIKAVMSVNREKLAQGELLEVRVSREVKPDKLTFNSNQSRLYREQNGDYIGLIGISYWTSPGSYSLILTTARGQIHKQEIRVYNPGFPESYLQVSEDQEKMVDPEPDPDIKERKQRDQQLLKKAYAQTRSEKLWTEGFSWPVDGEISTDFGAIRYVNGRLSSRHSGIDLAAPAGTPIRAPARGIITLAEELLVTGNTIVIDHGWNLFSSYSHLQQMQVKSGKEVEKGQVIGKIGSTGFSTGPHLHWVVKAGGVFINPRQLMD